MKRFSNYFLSLFAFASILFLASCGDDSEVPVGNTIVLSTPDNRINNDSLRAAPGESIDITPTLPVGNTGDITVITDNANIVAVPQPNTVSSGDAITITIPASATVGQIATLIFQNGSINQRLTVEVGYEYNTVVDIIADNDEYTILAEALEAAGLVETLSGAGPFTVFAPTNAAFAAAGFENFDDLPTDEAELAAILQYHVVQGTVLSSDLEAGEVETLGGTVVVTIDGQTIMINDATVTEADVVAGNGVVHAIDNVIMPADVTTYDAFLLFAPNSNAQSETFFSTSSGETYSFNEVVNSSENLSQTIDFGYFYGQSLRASLMSPDNYTADAGYDLSRWTTRNATSFRTTTLTPEDFSATTTGDQIEGHYETGTAPSNAKRVTQLAANNVVAFTTADGRFGLIRVVEVRGTTGTNDGIQIEVKVTNAM